MATLITTHLGSSTQILKSSDVYACKNGITGGAGYAGTWTENSNKCVTASMISDYGVQIDTVLTSTTTSCNKTLISALTTNLELQKAKTIPVVSTINWTSRVIRILHNDDTLRYYNGSSGNSQYMPSFNLYTYPEQALGTSYKSFLMVSTTQAIGNTQGITLATVNTSDISGTNAIGSICLNCTYIDIIVDKSNAYSPTQITNYLCHSSTVDINDLVGSSYTYGRIRFKRNGSYNGWGGGTWQIVNSSNAFNTTPPSFTDSDMSFAWSITRGLVLQCTWPVGSITYQRGDKTGTNNTLGVNYAVGWTYKVGSVTYKLRVMAIHFHFDTNFSYQNSYLLLSLYKQVQARIFRCTSGSSYLKTAIANNAVSFYVNGTSVATSNTAAQTATYTQFTIDCNCAGNENGISGINDSSPMYLFK